jgi:thiol-disulfide isomerase/thioredoxin
MKKFLTLILFAFTLGSYAQTIDFLHDDWATAQQRASELDKPIFIDFHTDWCGWCKVMDDKTFSQPEVIQFMNDRFICLKVDAEKGVGRQLAMKFRIGSFPTFGVLNSQGMLVDKISGFKKPEPFLEEMNKQVEKVNEGFMLEGVSPELELEYPEFYTKSFKNKDTKTKAVWPKDTVVYKYLRGADLMNEVVFSVYAKFGGNDEVNQNALALQDQLFMQFGEADVNKVLASILYKEYEKIEKDGNLEDFEKWLPRTERLMRDKGKMYQNHYQIKFYKKNEMWSRYTDKVDSMIKNDSAATSFVNSQSWDVYKNVDHKKTVKKAIGWMGKVVKKEPNYMYLDTYAALLHKAGKNSEAAKQAELAIKAGKESGEDVKATEKLLKKIKKSKS